MEMTKTRK